MTNRTTGVKGLRLTSGNPEWQRTVFLNGKLLHRSLYLSTASIYPTIFPFCGSFHWILSVSASLVCLHLYLLLLTAVWSAWSSNCQTISYCDVTQWLGFCFFLPYESTDDGLVISFFPTNSFFSSSAAPCHLSGRSSRPPCSTSQSTTRGHGAIWWNRWMGWTPRFSEMIPPRSPQTAAAGAENVLMGGTQSNNN